MFSPVINKKATLKQAHICMIHNLYWVTICGSLKCTAAATQPGPSQICHFCACLLGRLNCDASFSEQTVYFLETMPGSQGPQMSPKELWELLGNDLV